MPDIVYTWNIRDLLVYPETQRVAYLNCTLRGAVGSVEYAVIGNTKLVK